MKRLLSIEEVAEILQIPIPTLRAWRHKGTGIPSFRVGRHVRYDADDLEAWLVQQKEAGGGHSAATKAIRLSHKRQPA